MNIDLTGRSAVVTGASRGIGLAVTRALVASGAHVTAGARESSAELDKLTADGSVQVIEADLAAAAGPASLVAAAGDRVDILVNVVVLASDVGANVTGSDIRIDGDLIPAW
jgi:NAD(P)-dependent dehydrogenase (short-subunit alcohol dehydrogenase family)